MLVEADQGVMPGGRSFPPVQVYQAIRLVVFDVDGVLTDGRIIMDANGLESKFFHVRDGTGMTFLRHADLLQALLTGRSSPVVDMRARDLHIPPACVRQGAKVKLPVFQELLAELKVTAAQTVFVGDDMIDLPVLQAAALACCPQDAHPEVVKACHVVARCNGGHGAVRQICEHLLKRRGDGLWEKAIDRYLGRA